MAWVWLDDQMPDHKRVAALSVSALGAFVAGLCYCSRMRTDGYIPKRKAGELATSRRICVELETAEMWLPAPGGFQVRDYLDYQPSAAELEKQSMSNRERQRRWRKGKRNGVTNVDVTPLEVTTVTGTPTPTDQEPPVSPSRGGPKKESRDERKARERLGLPKPPSDIWQQCVRALQPRMEGGAWGRGFATSRLVADDGDRLRVEVTLLKWVEPFRDLATRIANEELQRPEAVRIDFEERSEAA